MNSNIFDSNIFDSKSNKNSKQKKTNNKFQSAKNIERNIIDQKNENDTEMDNVRKYSRPDPKRQLTKSEKNEVWNNSTYDDRFDNTIFRLDYLDNTIIKDIRYANNNCSYRFAGEYDHKIPHSKGGRTDTQNVRLLAASVNRNKTDKNIYDNSVNEISGFNMRHCVNIDNLLKDLLCNLHNTCEKHNLLFTFDNYNNYWTIEYTKIKGKNIYRPYNGEYDNSRSYNNFRNYRKNRSVLSY